MQIILSRVVLQRSWFPSVVVSLVFSFVVFIVSVPHAEAQSFSKISCDCGDLDIISGADIAIVVAIVVGVILVTGAIVNLVDDDAPNWYSDITERDVTLNAENKSPNRPGVFLGCSQKGPDLTLACW